MSQATVLLSGGIDSATCLALATVNCDVIQPVHFNYGQQTSEFEEEQAQNLVSHYSNPDSGGYEMLPLTTIDYQDVFDVFGQGVASDRDGFVTEDGSLEEEDGRSTGYVPMRNLHLLSTAAAITDISDGDTIYIGVQGGDQESYPDCRPEFVSAAEEAINASLAESDEISVRAPLVHRDKVEVIEFGDGLGVPWEYTYSCYEAIRSENPEPCGECPACIERGEAFYSAQIEDPFGTPGAVNASSPDRWEEILESVSFR